MASEPEEPEEERRDRDGLWKKYLWHFLRVFLMTFAPDVAAEVDWDTLEFLTPELYTKVRGGARRFPDLVVRAKRLDGEPQVFVMHFEIEGERRREAAGRLFEYSILLRIEYDCPVLSWLGVLAPGGRGRTEDT